MTLATTTQKAQYAGNGSTTAFSVPFQYTSTAEIEAILTSAAGVDSTLTIVTHYTLTSPGASGTLTMITAPASGETLTIRGVTAQTQTVDLTAGGAFSAEVVEGSLDKLTRIAQQLLERIRRAPLFRASSSQVDVTLPEPEAGKLLRWNSDADDLENAAGADIDLAVVSPFIETLLDDTSAATARATLGAIGGSTGGTDNRLLRANGTGGATLDASALSADDSGNVSGVVNLTQTGYQDITEISAPGSPAANVARVYCVDDGGSTTLALKDSAGSVVALSHFKQSGTGGVARTQHAKLGDVFHARDFGAVGDGVTDDTAEIQAACDAAAAAGGGRVDLTGGRWLIDSADLEIPAGVLLVGPYRNVGPDLLLGAEYSTIKSAIILNSSYTLRLVGDHSGVIGLVGIRKGMTIPQTTVAAIEHIGDFAGTFLTVGDGTFSPPNQANDSYFGFCHVAGFARCYHNNGSVRPRVEYIFADCTTGIEMQNVFDMNHLSHCHMWPATTAHLPAATFDYAVTGAVNNGSGLIRLTVTGHPFTTGDAAAVRDVGGVPNANTRYTVTVINANTIDLQGSTFGGAYTSGGTVNALLYRRSGAAYLFEDSTDWGQADNCFEYGWDIGYQVENCDHCVFVNCGSDNLAAAEDLTPIGWLLGDGCGQPLLIGCKAAAKGRGVVVFNGLSSAAEGVARIQSLNSWGIINVPVHVVTGRAIVTGCAISNAPFGVLVESGAGAGVVADCEFDAVTTPISINSSLMRSWIVDRILGRSSTLAVLDGTVTQATSKSTGVTLNAYAGTITMNGATLNAATTVSFTLTNAAISAKDVLAINPTSGSGTAGAYAVSAECSNGSAQISVRNITAGNLTEGLTLRFRVLKQANL